MCIFVSRCYYLLKKILLIKREIVLAVSFLLQLLQELKDLSLDSVDFFEKRTKYKLKQICEAIQAFKEKNLLALARGSHHFIISHIMSSFPIICHNDQLAH